MTLYTASIVALLGLENFFLIMEYVQNLTRFYKCKSAIINIQDILVPVSS